MTESAAYQPVRNPQKVRRSLHLRAAVHEVKCAECRVTWRSWWQRIIGDPRGMTP